MNPKITELVERIRQIEHEIELETKRRRAELQADFDHLLGAVAHVATGCICHPLSVDLLSGVWHIARQTQRVFCV